MATSLLLLLDDIATLLDDVAAMTKVAAHKTAGVLGDDLALNARQVAGVRADRELPVVWAVAKGSTVNKLILIPLALAISALAPWAVTPLLVLGGAYLCFEGMEKLAHRLIHGPEPQRSAVVAPSAAVQALGAVPAAELDIPALERAKVRGAIRTDFILSAEIIVISLGTVATAPLTEQLLVLLLVGGLMTLGVYGAVAGIVKLDDLGLLLTQRHATGLWHRVGLALLTIAPKLMVFLSVAGTLAMFTVGGSIVAHAWPALHHGMEAAAPAGSAGPWVTLLLQGLTGLAVGAVLFAVWTLGQRFLGPKAQAAS